MGKNVIVDNRVGATGAIGADFVARSPADGSTIWCNSSGLCKGDQLLLVCRDMRTIRSVELALRTFTLANSHDRRVPPSYLGDLQVRRPRI
jgi:hypothetical protein